MPTQSNGALTTLSGLLKPSANREKMPKFSPKTIEGLPEAIQDNLNVDAAQDAVDIAFSVRLDYLETLSDAINRRLDALESACLEGSFLITYQRVDERKTTS